MKNEKVKYCLLGLALAMSGILFPCRALHAQDFRQRIDSMISGKPIEEQLEILNQANLDYRFIDLPFANEICDTAMAIASKSENMKFIARAVYNQGAIQFLSEEFDAADSLYKKSVEMYQSVSDTLGMSRVFISLSYLYRRTSRFREAKNIIRKAIEIYSDISDTSMVRDCYYSLANVYHVQGEYDSAYCYYSRVLEMDSLINDPKLKLSLLIDLGALLESQNHFDEALEYYNSAIKIADSQRIMRYKSTIYRNIGLIYLQTGENLKALDVLFKALYISDSLNLQDGVARTMLLIGKAYELEGNLQRANELYIQSLDVFYLSGDMQQVADALIFIGTNLKEQGQYQSAIQYYMTSLGVALDAGLHLQTSENYRCLLFIYASLSQEDSAMKYLELYSDLQRKLDIDITKDELLVPAAVELAEGTADHVNIIKTSDSDTSEMIIANWVFAIVIITGLIIFIFILFAMLIIRRAHKRYKM